MSVERGVGAVPVKVLGIVASKGLPYTSYCRYITIVRMGTRTAPSVVKANVGVQVVAKAKRPPKAKARKPKVTGASALPARDPECLLHASFVPPSSVEVRFADGFAGVYQLKSIDVDPAELRLPTIKASASGNALEVQSARGEDLRIDSEAIRILVDAEYAARMDELVKASYVPAAELARLANTHKAPQAWYDRREERPF
jgi:hypothetical protein